MEMDGAHPKIIPALKTGLTLTNLHMSSKLLFQKYSI